VGRVRKLVWSNGPARSATTRPGAATPRCSPPMSSPMCVRCRTRCLTSRPGCLGRRPGSHVHFGRALYRVTGELVGQRLAARVDPLTVKLAGSRATAEPSLSRRGHGDPNRESRSCAVKLQCSFESVCDRWRPTAVAVSHPERWAGFLTRIARPRPDNRRSIESGTAACPSCCSGQPQRLRNRCRPAQRPPAG
jgi:hypothetical protein